MNINNAFPSKYLKSGDVTDSDLIYTITTVVVENVGQGEEQETKPIVYFAETDKGMVLNKTNAGTIAHLYGPETEGWIGKKIAIFATEVDFAGKQTLALRVRMKPPQSQKMTVGAAIQGGTDSKPWREEITQLALQAKALADTNHDPILATMCRTAVDNARVLFKLNGSATPEQIAEGKGMLVKAIAEASADPSDPF